MSGFDPAGRRRPSRALSRRRFVALAAQGLGVTGAVSACGTSHASSGRLEFWMSFPSVAVQQYFQQRFVGAYNSRARVPVTLSAKPSSAIDRLTQTALSAGGGPDIVTADGPSEALSYMRAGKLASLDRFVDTYHWDRSLLPWALLPGRVDGALYSVPYQNETMALFYNPATFEKHGWAPPRDRAEFEAICEEAKGRGMMPIAAGNANWQAATEWYVTIFLNHAAGPRAVYEALNGRLAWTDPVFVDAVTLMRDYFQRGWWGGSVPDYFTNQTADLYAALADGKAAMMPTGTWAFADLPGYFGPAAGNNDRWAWATLPRFADHVPPVVWDLSVGGTYSINSNSADLEAAAEYLNFLISDPRRQMTTLAAVSLEPPPLRLTRADYPADLDPRLRRLYQEFQAATTVGYTTWTFWPPKSDTYIYTEMEKVVTGEVSPASYCHGLQQLFRQERSAGNVPASPPPSGGL